MANAKSGSDDLTSAFKWSPSLTFLSAASRGTLHDSQLYCKKALAAVPGGVLHVHNRAEDGALISFFSGVDSRCVR
jgi:hypothetical protein